MLTLIIRCKKTEKITTERKKIRLLEKKQSDVIFQISFATKPTKDTLKEWHLPSHKEPTKATSKPLMPNSTP
jgi:hypothetical protein